MEANAPLLTVYPGVSWRSVCRDEGTALVLIGAETGRLLCDVGVHRHYVCMYVCACERVCVCVRACVNVCVPPIV